MYSLKKYQKTAKLKRCAIILETKIEILNRLRNEEGSIFFSKMFGLNGATVNTIKVKFLAKMTYHISLLFTQNAYAIENSDNEESVKLVEI